MADKPSIRTNAICHDCGADLFTTQVAIEASVSTLEVWCINDDCPKTPRGIFVGRNYLSDRKSAVATEEFCGAAITCSACQGKLVVPLKEGNFIPVESEGLCRAQGVCKICGEPAAVPIAALIMPDP